MVFPAAGLRLTAKDNNPIFLEDSIRMTQDVFIEALNTKLTTDQVEIFRKHYLGVHSYLDTTFQCYGIDIIVAPGDCFLTQYASAKGTIFIP
jgi:hypothetical protein